MKRIILAALVGVLVSGPGWKANATEALNQIEKLAFANLHDEMIQCSAYYSLTLEFFRKEPNPDKKTIEKLVKVKKHLSERITALGEVIGMKLEATLAMMRLVFRKMSQELDGNSLNYPILIEKYGGLCKVVYENSDSRVRHWMKEVAK